jgi:hypothetical protein
MANFDAALSPRRETNVCSFLFLSMSGGDDCEEIMSRVRVSIAAAALTIAFSGHGFALGQDKLSTINGVQVVCTGVGSSKNNPSWASFPVKLVFANRQGQFTAGENVEVRQDRHVVLKASCDAPWLLLQPSAGQYEVTAMLRDYNRTRRTSGTFSTSGSGHQKTVTLEFPMASTG